MMYSTFRCKIVVDKKDMVECERVLAEYHCSPVLISYNRWRALFAARVTPEERLLLKLRVNIIQIQDYHVHEDDRYPGKYIHEEDDIDHSLYHVYNRL